MSLLATIYVASEADSLSFKGFHSHEEALSAGKFEAEDFTSITPFDLESLWAILENVEWEVETHGLKEIWCNEDFGEMISRFPAEFVQLLAHVGDQDADKALAAWAATDETDCTPAEARPILVALRKLAKSALNLNRSLFLWISL